MKRIPVAVRNEVLARDRRKCAYCGGYADQVDHVRPQWWLQMHGLSTIDPQELVAACGRCNMMAGGKVFDSFEEKRAWIQRMLSSSGDQDRGISGLEAILGLIFWVVLWYLWYLLLS